MAASSESTTSAPTRAATSTPSSQSTSGNGSSPAQASVKKGLAGKDFDVQLSSLMPRDVQLSPSNAPPSNAPPSQTTPSADEKAKEGGEEKAQEGAGTPEKKDPLTSDDVPKVPIKSAPEGTPVEGPQIQKDFGMPADNAKAFQEVADKYDVVIKVRPTNPKSVELLKQGALAKPEYLKAKSIKPEDFWLGADKSKEGTVGYFQPPSEADLEWTLQTANPPLSDAEKAKIRDRRKERAAEFKELAPKMEALQNPKGDHPIYIQDGVVMDTKTGKPFTGDHDIFSITNRDGTPADKAKVTKIVETLKPFGVEHPPHMNWEVPNDTMNQGIDGTVRNNHTPKDQGGDGEGLLCFGKEEPPKVGYHKPKEGEVDENKRKRDEARKLADGPAAPKKSEDGAADPAASPKPNTDEEAPPTKRSATDEAPKDNAAKPGGPPKPNAPTDDGPPKKSGPTDDGPPKKSGPTDDGPPKKSGPTDDAPASAKPPTAQSGHEAAGQTPPAQAGGGTPPAQAGGGTPPAPAQGGGGTPPAQAGGAKLAPAGGAAATAPGGGGDAPPPAPPAPKPAAPAPKPAAPAPKPAAAGGGDGPAPAAGAPTSGPKPGPDQSTVKQPPKPSSEPPKPGRQATRETSGALVDKGDSPDGKKPRNGSTSVDISDISKGKVDIGYNFNLATIKTTLPILGAAGGGSGAGVFLELSASAGLFANGSLEVPPGDEAWSGSVKGGIATNATVSLKGGVQLNAGPVSAEASISAYAKADATAGCGVKVTGKGTNWQVAGRETGIEADVSASVGVAATLQAGLPGFSVGQTWNIAGPYTLPIVHASYPIEGEPSLSLSAEVKALPGKVASGIAGLVDKIAASAKQAIDDTVDSITGLDEKRKEEDATRAAGIEATNNASSEWRAWKDEIGFNTGGVFNEVGRAATTEEVDNFNALGTKFREAYEAQQKVLALGTVAAAYDPIMSQCKNDAKALVGVIKARVAEKKAKEEAARQAKKAEEDKSRADIVAAQGKLRTKLMELAKAHDNLNYHGNKALIRGVSNARLHPHFDPANNAYLPLYNRANAMTTAATATVDSCAGVQSEIDALIGTTRAGADAIKGLS